MWLADPAPNLNPVCRSPPPGREAAGAPLTAHSAHDQRGHTVRGLAAPAWRQRRWAGGGHHGLGVMLLRPAWARVRHATVIGNWHTDQCCATVAPDIECSTPGNDGRGCRRAHSEAVKTGTDIQRFAAWAHGWAARHTRVSSEHVTAQKIYERTTLGRVRPTDAVASAIFRRTTACPA